MHTKQFIALLMSFCLYTSLRAQQVPDFSYQPAIKKAAYPTGKGPVVLIDEAHNNFHTIATRYHAFARVLSEDGYQVKPYTQAFSVSGLKDASILVIANAIHESNTNNWTLPTPSAFTKDEITTIHEWVKNGGSLFLIADHMPFPGASHDLAQTFGFTFYNGFATDTTSGLFPGNKRELDVFIKSNETLKDVPVDRTLRSEYTPVDSIATFTGQAFEIPPNAISILTFDDRYKILLPDTAWKFSQQTKRIPIKGFSQGAVLSYGKGRVAVFGEAAMFTAQLKGSEKIPFGLNSPDARQNLTFLLNIIHWLDPNH
jgi:hypothetical protein